MGLSRHLKEKKDEKTREGINNRVTDKDKTKTGTGKELSFLKLVVGDTCNFQVSRYLILWLEVSVVSGTIPIPQNDVIVCQAVKRTGDFHGERTTAGAYKSPSAYFLDLG